MVSLNLKKMGISVPEIARGINRHESIRQSALTMDGPGLDRPLRNHEFVILASTGKRPAFLHLESGEGEDQAALVEKLQGVTKGGNIDADPAYDPTAFVGECLSWIREKIFLVINGSDHAEMPLIKPMHTPGSFSADDACIQVRKAAIGSVVMPDVPVANVNDIVMEGCLSVYVNVDTGDPDEGKVIVAPTGLGSVFAGYTEYPIEGTIVTRATVKNVKGVDRVVVNFVC